MARAGRAKVMHFGLSSHRAEHSWWYYMGRTFDSDVNDPKYAGLYGPAHRTGLPADAPTNWPDSSQLQNWMPPSKAVLNDWSARTTEQIGRAPVCTQVTNAQRVCRRPLGKKTSQTHATNKTKLTERIKINSTD